ncbi:MAG TPA: sigma 54-interacting transcriptional regulator, partial [Pyrinomonadaceae bacterium]|nr:sigma 54-interacting transcriptional regulator [Pyrinomonadaceae bacterium]
KRVGSSQTVRVDTRVVAATNRDLEREVKAGSFREDLFYRLSVVTIRVPPLRERRTDVPLLAELFLRAAAAKSGRRRLRFSPEALKLLVAYEWPGNVRELESFVEYAALHARAAEVMPEDLPQRLQADEMRAASRAPLAALFEDLPSLDEVERRYLLHVLKTVGGNRTRAAEILGIDRRTLYRMAERFNIKW